MKSTPITSKTLTISTKGQITLPSATRKRLGLQKGDKLRVVRTGDQQVTLEKQKSFRDFQGTFMSVFPRDAVAAIRELRDRE